MKTIGYKIENGNRIYPPLAIHMCIKCLKKHGNERFYEVAPRLFRIGEVKKIYSTSVYNEKPICFFCNLPIETQVA